MRNRDSRRRGNSLIEFTLVGIPLMFVLISVFELSRGMWVYHTLAYAVKEGTRYISVHGVNCSTAPNSCAATVGTIATRIKEQGIGLLPSELNLTMQTQFGTTITCSPLSSCFNNTTVWPPDPDNTPGFEVTMNVTYPFRSAIALFWPGASRGQVFPTITLACQSRTKMEF